jgi:hypothetical protein
MKEGKLDHRYIFDMDLLWCCCIVCRLMKGETATTDEIKEFCKGKVEHVSYLKLLTLINVQII